ncbi:ATP-binding protein [Pseudomonas corrugata]|uniref:ATP-binding protein n=1 Tax=Pseudomonas corrugata TaxID=47879 RepID=UPI00223418DA|nr:ATP-binding protein [Pseudomonas corrugata]UZE07033.1 ATP-binding protein [Pseudomonas corrugata]
MKLSFVVGPNGVGKSQHLIELARASQEGHAIFICNTVHDRSYVLKNTKRFSIRNSASRPANVIKSVLKKVLKEGTHRLNQIDRVLSYCGYQSYITITVKTGELDKRAEGHADIPFIQHMLGLMERSFEGKNRKEFHVSFNGDYDTNTVVFLESLFTKSKTYKQLGLISAIDIDLYRKDGSRVPLAHASSGELSLITSMLFILSEMEGSNLLLIDEPENSLHPKWQREYIRTLYSLLSYHEIEIVVATHSPLIVAGARMEMDVNASIYHPSNGLLDKSYSKNIESLLWEQFDTISPSSRFLSDRLSIELDRLSRKEITEETAQDFIDSAMSASFDDTQNDLFLAAKKLAASIARG